MLTANRITPKNRSAWASVSTSFNPITTHSPDATDETFDVRIFLIMHDQLSRQAGLRDGVARLSESSRLWVVRFNPFIPVRIAGLLAGKLALRRRASSPFWCEQNGFAVSRKVNSLPARCAYQ